MNPAELTRFIRKRAKSDTPLAFACRMARFAVISPYMLSRMSKVRACDSRIADCVLQEIQGSDMYLDLHDKGLSIDLLLDGIREPLITKVIQHELSPTDVCIDIGANVGYYALQEARLAKYVYAIEPVSESVESLCRNIRANGYQNIEVHQLACGSRCGRDVINVSKKRNLSSMVAGDREYVNQQSVEMVSLDKFVEGKALPDFVRMDVEGYEYEIVKGMSKILSTNRPMKLFIEMHFDLLGWRTLEIAYALKTSGFEIAFATVEPHPAIASSRIGLGIVKLLEKGIGVPTGYAKTTLDDLIHDRKYRSGQVEWMEILFVR